jgi:serine/threonine protein kinase/tetratricopeptide (TPR) repeat protein
VPELGGGEVAPAPPLPTVPGFEILEEVGRGATSVVYKARQLGLNRLVALKIILQEMRSAPAHLARFRAEAEAVARLQHPHIVQIHAVGELDGRPYLALEFVDGGSLAQRLTDFRLPAFDWKTGKDAAGHVWSRAEYKLRLRRIVNLLGTLARAMHYAHQRDVLHLDLKPANILMGCRPSAFGVRPSALNRRPGTTGSLSGRGFRLEDMTDWDPFWPAADGQPPAVVKITDFGLARRFGKGRPRSAPELPAADGSAVPTTENTPNNTDQGAPTAVSIEGTPNYLSPEQAECKPHLYGPPSDVYALGVILYELLTGRPPFRGESEVDALLKLVLEQPEPPRKTQPQLPADLEAICLKCLAKDPAGRYATAGELADDLHRFLLGNPVRARRPVWWERGRHWARRRPALTAGVGVGLAAVAAGLTGLWWHHHTVVTLARRQAAEVQALAERSAESESARQDSEAQLVRAREVIDQLVALEQEWLSPPAGADSQRRDLLQEALVHYERALQDPAAPAAARFEAARTYQRLGEMEQRLGHLQQAEYAYRHAVALLGRLTGENVRSVEYRRELAACQLNVGLVYKATQRLTGAEEAYRAALRLYRQLTAEQPGVPTLAYAQSICHSNLGALLQLTGRPREAEDAYREALRLQDALAANRPREVVYRHAAAVTRSNLGTLLQAGGQAAEAERAYRQAVTAFEGLMAEDSAQAECRWSLAVTLDHLGTLLQTTERAGEAEPLYRKALEHFQRLMAEFPAVPDYRFHGSRCQANLGTLLQNTNRPNEANEVYRGAVQALDRLAAEFPNVKLYQDAARQARSTFATLVSFTKPKDEPPPAVPIPPAPVPPQ